MNFLEAIFFSFRKTLFKFLHKIFIIILCDITGLENFLLSFCQSQPRITMRNFHWCYTFCTGVTLFTLILHLNCTALSQSESYNFFMYRYTIKHITFDSMKTMTIYVSQSVITFYNPPPTSPFLLMTRFSEVL